MARFRPLPALFALAASLALAGCVAYPAGPYYAQSVYAPPVVVAGPPAVYIGGGWGWHGGWRR